MINLFGRISALAAWSVSAWFLLFPGETWFARVCAYLFWALLLIHGTECVYLYRLLRKAGRPVLLPLVLTMLFGVFHLVPIRAQLHAGGDMR